MRVKAHRWGNSWAVRLSQRELKRLGIEMHEGKDLELSLHEVPAKWDVSMLPSFGDPHGPKVDFNQVRKDAWKALAEERLAGRRHV